MSSVPAGFVEKWSAYGRAWETWNPWALAIGAGTVALIALWPKRWQRLPSAIVALAVSALVVRWFRLPVETIPSRFGGIPQGLPMPHWPAVTWEQLRILFPSAVTVALLGAIESLLSAVVADGLIGGRHKSNRELVAQGVANIASPLFGGIPATGAIARTATNVRNGGRTPIAGDDPCDRSFFGSGYRRATRRRDTACDLKRHPRGCQLQHVRVALVSFSHVRTA